MTAGDEQWVREMEAEANGASASQIQVLRSLRRSRVRTEVAMYLYEIYPVAYYRLSEQGKSVMDEVVIYDTT